MDMCILLPSMKKFLAYLTEKSVTKHYGTPTLLLLQKCVIFLLKFMPVGMNTPLTIRIIFFFITEIILDNSSFSLDVSIQTECGLFFAFMLKADPDVVLHI